MNLKEKLCWTIQRKSFCDRGIWRWLFDFSLEEVEEAGWTLEKSTFDLHNSEYVEGNIMTEYEEKFVAKGNPICMLQIFYKENK